MKYSAYLNGLMILSSDSINACIKQLIDPIPDHEAGGWNRYFKDNHAHVVNNEEVTIAWASRIIDNRKVNTHFLLRSITSNQDN